MINKIIGQRMKMLRKSLNLTQKQFAHHIPGKIDYTYIGKIERGQQYPSIKMLEKIANCYGILIGYFFQINDPSARSVAFLIRIRKALFEWTLRTQDMLSHSTQDIDEIVKGILEDSREEKNKTR